MKGWKMSVRTKEGRRLRMELVMGWPRVWGGEAGREAEKRHGEEWC